MSASTITYRRKRSLRSLSLVGLILFGLMTIVAPMGMLLNIDGSVRHPLLAAVVMFLICGTFTGLAIWMSLTYQRYRLHVSDASIEQVSFSQTNITRVDDITQADWLLPPRGGCLHLHTAATDFQIELGDFGPTDRLRIIHRLRAIIPPHLQQDWNTFESRFLKPAPERVHQQRSLERLLTWCLLGCAVPFAIAPFVGAGWHFLPIAAINVWLLMNYRKQTQRSNALRKQLFDHQD